MGRALVLNVSNAPLAVVPARRAVVLVLKDKAEVVLSNGMVFHSERVVVEAPSIVRLRRYVRIPYRAHAPLTRRAVFARDEWACQYCGASAENLDHVLPRSRGGLHVWENVVAACRRCNAKKEDKTPGEAGFHLARQPFAPRDGFHLTLGRPEPGWDAYLSIGGSLEAPRPSHIPPPLIRAPPNSSSGAFPVDAVECRWHKCGTQWRKGEETGGGAARHAPLPARPQGQGVAAGEVP